MVFLNVHGWVFIALAVLMRSNDLYHLPLVPNVIFYSPFFLIIDNSFLSSILVFITLVRISPHSLILELAPSINLSPSFINIKISAERVSIFTPPHHKNAGIGNDSSGIFLLRPIWLVRICLCLPGRIGRRYGRYTARWFPRCLKGI